jgi:hypothetical protein
MSRPEEAYRIFLKKHNCVYNLTINGRDYKLNKIVDSFRGIEGVEIDAKEIKKGVYDFIISFGTYDDEVFHHKLGALEKIRRKDFPKTRLLAMRKFR